MGLDVLALAAIVLLAPFALYGAWALWRAPHPRDIAAPNPETTTGPQQPAVPDPWLGLPLALAGFDKEDRLIGASRAFRDELTVRGVALDDVLRPGIAAQALFDAWAQRSGGSLTPITAVATLPAHELVWPAIGGRGAHRLACIALHDPAGGLYRLLVDPAILSATPVVPMNDERADSRAIIARNAVLASALQS